MTRQPSCDICIPWARCKNLVLCYELLHWLNTGFKYCSKVLKRPCVKDYLRNAGFPIQSYCVYAEYWTTLSNTSFHSLFDVLLSFFLSSIVTTTSSLSNFCSGISSQLSSDLASLLAFEQQDSYPLPSFAFHLSCTDVDSVISCRTSVASFTMSNDLSICWEGLSSLRYSMLAKELTRDISSGMGGMSTSCAWSDSKSSLGEKKTPHEIRLWLLNKMDRLREK